MADDFRVSSVDEMIMNSEPVKFVIGSRKLLEVRRRLTPIHFTLAHLIGDQPIDLPDPIEAGAQGYRIRSAPQSRMEAIQKRYPGHILGGYQAYQRHYIDMNEGFDAYMARFSGKTRSTLKRKRRKLAELNGGTLDVRAYHDANSLSEFLERAVPLSRKTYQTRLLDVGLPEGDAATARMIDLARQGRVRAWLLFLNGDAISYLYLTITDAVISYDFLGYAPESAPLSPGTVLQMEALEELFAEGCFRYFDFTEGDGAHKRMFGTDSIAACSFFLLKPDISNRLLMGALNIFDGSVAGVKKLTEKSGALAKVRKVLRGKGG